MGNSWAPRPDAHTRSVVRYFDECWFDYRWFWANRRNLAMHFGYWDEQTRTHGDAVVRTNQVLADVANITSSDHVLDAGCGVAGSCIWLAAERGVTVVGVNIVASQIRRGRRYVRKRGLQDQVTLLHRDYLDTGLPSECFDVVWACESLPHCPDYHAFLAEAYRLLKPGGRLIVWDPYLRRQPASALERNLLDSLQSAWAVHTLITLPQFIAWVREAGFIDISATDTTPQSEPDLQHLYRITRITRPIERMFYWIRLRSEVQHANALAPIALWRLYTMGMGMSAITLARRPEDGPSRAGGCQPSAGQR